MRVIGGEFRSRLLKAVPGMDVRPTPDRVRQAVFDILAPRIEGSTFVDAYAGTGSMGIEALSRGARHAVFLELSGRVVQVLRQNLSALGLENRSTVVQGPALAGVGRYTGGIVFLDPPYPLESEYAAAFELLGERPPDELLVQHSFRLKTPRSAGRLEFFRELRRGDNLVSFFRPREAG